jgi:hypothetical protein
MKSFEYFDIKFNQLGLFYQEGTSKEGKKWENHGEFVSTSM